MDRRNFIGLSIAGGMLASFPALASASSGPKVRKGKKEMAADLVVAGGGMGGCAAALAALRNGLSVIMTEETDWIGGQVTQQGVPPDEHPWIETHGATALYRDFRNRIRDYYLRNYPLTEEARKVKYLNPGNGAVSRLCHEPQVALAVLYEMLYPFISTGKLSVLLDTRIRGADVAGNRVRSLKAVHLRTKEEIGLTAPYFVDATELGDLLPLTGTKYRTGAESRSETRELHAPE
ncbi:MAG: FAD-dependent oxidoreductase, partial [Bacteroidales bacterium]|nr:FAD-dependent oxidoreductase [Bacteroidales bacterium]